MRCLLSASLALSLTLSLAAALRTSNSGANSVFDIFVETNAISDTNATTQVAMEVETAGPPPHDQHARMARYVCHKSDWGAMATIAIRDPIVGFPFANVFSLSDGPTDESSGVPYIYATPWEISFHDLRADPRASITMSLAEGTYCRDHQLDPEDPRCAHIILTGNILAVAEDSKEREFAEQALFSRHPAMLDWPKDHGWFIAKLNISNILLLDYFGGAITVPVEEYFAATVDPE